MSTSAPQSSSSSSPPRPLPPPPPPPPQAPLSTSLGGGVKRLLDDDDAGTRHRDPDLQAGKRPRPPEPGDSGQQSREWVDLAGRSAAAAPVRRPPPPPPPPPLPSRQPSVDDSGGGTGGGGRKPPRPPPPPPFIKKEAGEVEEGELEDGEVDDDDNGGRMVTIMAAVPPPPPPAAGGRKPPPPPPPLPAGFQHRPPRPLKPPPPPPPPRSSSGSGGPPTLIRRTTPPPPPRAPPRAGAGALLPPEQIGPLPPLLGLPAQYGRSVQAFRDRQMIGKGTYGEVSRAVDKETGETVALKKMSLTLPGEANQKEGLAITALREIKVLQKLKHKNIVALKEVVTEEGRSRIPREIYLVLEYCESDLSGVVRTCTLLGLHIRSYMYQILAGLAYIQRHGLLHRDLKTANILVTRNHLVKIADWGLCRWEPERKLARLTNPVVTLWYRAPELLLGTARYGRAVDMWSCGAIFVELLTGKPFVEGRDELDQLARLFDICGTPPYDGQYSGPRFVRRTPRLGEELRRRGVRDEKAIALAEQLLAVDPKKRPSADAAADDDYFWSPDEAGNFHAPSEDPASLPRLVSFRPGVDMDDLHEWNVKRR